LAARIGVTSQQLLNIVTGTKSRILPGQYNAPDVRVFLQLPENCFQFSVCKPVKSIPCLRPIQDNRSYVFLNRKVDRLKITHICFLLSEFPAAYFEAD
jgi:hypothetical protein